MGWAERRSGAATDATYAGIWELSALGQVADPATELIQPDGYVTWVEDTTMTGLGEALTT